MNNVHIYALIDPFNNHIFYVGCTEDVKARYLTHLNAKDGTAKSKRVRNITLKGGKPEMLHLETVKVFEASFYEEFYIQLFTSYGFTLSQLKSSDYSKRYGMNRYYRYYCHKMYRYLDDLINTAPPDWQEYMLGIHGYKPKQNETT